MHKWSRGLRYQSWIAPIALRDRDLYRQRCRDCLCLQQVGGPFMKLLTHAFAGALFALGLVLSKMTQPSKVLGFLDVFGNWDPSLGLVMVGAIAVHFFAYRAIKNRSAPVLARRFHVPTSRKIDPQLI